MFDFDLCKFLLIFCMFDFVFLLIDFELFIWMRPAEVNSLEGLTLSIDDSALGEVIGW